MLDSRRSLSSGARKRGPLAGATARYFHRRHNLAAILDYIPLHPAPSKERFMSVTRRGAGCGSLACDRRVARKAQVQAAPRRGTVPGDGGGAFHRWRWSRPVTRRARNAE